MKALFILAVLAFSGCATIERHPRASAVIAGVLVTSIALSSSGHSDREPPMSEPLIATPSVNCEVTSCH